MNVRDLPKSPTRFEPRRAASTPRSLGTGAAVMVVLTTLASVVNYGSNLVFSRLLPPARYGDLTALVALSVVIAVPTGAAQTLVAERVAVLLADGRVEQFRFLIRHAFAHVLVISLTAAALYAALIPVVTGALDLEGPGPAIALLPLVLVSFLVPVALGVLQGMDRFVALGAVTLFVAGSRLLFGVPLTALTGGAGGALAGYAIGNYLALIVVAWLLRRHLLRRGTGAATSGFKRRINGRTAAAGAAFVAFALLSNLDIVLAKVFMPRQEVGYYAALSTLGKIVIFLPAAVAVVMVPNAARARHSSGSSARVLRIAAALVLVTTLLAAIPAALAPGLVLRLMFGGEYDAARAGVLPMVAAGAGLALLYLLVVYSVAIRDRRWVAVLVLGVVLQVAGISLFHGSPAQVATVQAVVVAVILALNEIGFHPLISGETRRLGRGRI